MGLLKKILGKEDAIPVEEGYCPNCWGRQEYQDQIREAAKKDNIDLNNVDARKGWIAGYATKYLTGLKKAANLGGKKKCPSCHG